MSAWRDQLQETHTRLKRWYRAGGIDEHAWILGLHLLAGMNELKTIAIRGTLGHFAHTFVHYNGKILAPPIDGLDVFYLGALQSLQSKVGIFSNVSENRLCESMDDARESPMSASRHVSTLLCDDRDHVYIQLDTPLYFCAITLDNLWDLETLEASVIELYPQECPAWMAR